MDTALFYLNTCNKCCKIKVICYNFVNMVKQMTVRDFAHKLKCNRSTVYRMIKGKALPDGVTASVLVGHIVIEVNPEIFKK